MGRHTRNFQYVAYLWVALVWMCSCAVASPTACVLGDFMQQMETVWRHIRMTPEQRRDLKQMTRHVRQTIYKQYPDWTVEKIGSTAMGLDLKWSDGDFFVFTSNSTQIDKDNGTMINTARRVLEQRPDLFNSFDVKHIETCPVLEFIHIPTAMMGDLTFSVPVIIPDSALIRHLLNLDDKFFQLAEIIKYWSYVHLVADCPPCLPSYAMTILVLFFLQQKNMIPPVANLQKNIDPVLINHWNTAFNRLQYNPRNNDTLYDLLGEFFKYYSNFDFEDNIVSVFCGSAIKKKDMENLQLPETLQAYTDNLRMGYAEIFNYGVINIQDIFKFSLNVARPWNGRPMLDRLISHLKFAAAVYESAGKDKFLLTILKPHKNMDIDLLNPLWSTEPNVSETCLDKSFF